MRWRGVLVFLQLMNLFLKPLVVLGLESSFGRTSGSLKRSLTDVQCSLVNTTPDPKRRLFQSKDFQKLDACAISVCLFHCTRAWTRFINFLEHSGYPRSFTPLLCCYQFEFTWSLRQDNDIHLEAAASVVWWSDIADSQAHHQFWEGARSCQQLPGSLLHIPGLSPEGPAFVLTLITGWSQTKTL